MKAIGPSNLWKKRLGDWVINPYVGCEHGCKFCYCPAMPGVKFNNGGHTQEEWGKYIIAKTGFVDAVRHELKRFTPDKAKTTEWGDGWILASFLTDCYTPAEAKHKITRASLQLILEAGHKVRVQTRSALAERDFDLLVAHKERVLFGTSLPHLDDRLARVLEPGASSPTRRLRMLHKARDAGLPVYVAIAPVMPFHREEEFNRVLNAVWDLEPREIFCEPLNPKGGNLAMVHETLVPYDAYFAEMIATYTEQAWAMFTDYILTLGVSKHARFVPWPDTMRRWKKWLPEASVQQLDTYLPPHAVN